MGEEMSEIAYAPDRINGVLFDMDGTLFSTQDLIVHCLNETSHKYLKKTLPRDNSLWGIGPPARKIVRHFAESLPDRPVNEAISYYESLYQTNFRDNAVEFQGVEQLLQELRDSGRTLGIVTSETAVLSDYALEAFKLRDYFDALITSDQVIRRKPDPEGTQMALQKLQLNPQQAMIIGDSSTDIIAGKRAGLLTGAALWGGETWGNPRDANPEILFPSIHDVSNFFSKSAKDRNLVK